MPTERLPEPQAKDQTRGLRVNTFQVRRVSIADRTQLNGDALHLSRHDVLTAARMDPRIVSADLELVEPGESARVTAIKDVIEPRIKVEGPGQVYPGVAGREVTAVGQGTTNRLAGVSVVLVNPAPSFGNTLQSRALAHSFFDMSGPGADASPYGKIRHLCLVLEANPSLHIDDTNEALHGAALRVADLLARVTVGLEPDSSECFDTDLQNPGLPGVVYIPCMNSPQHYSDSLHAYGVAIYGLTRLTPPWVLRPTEVIDGAICGRYSWQMANNPVVTGLLREHAAGKCNFRGVITVRTRWSSQSEKDITSNQCASIARNLGAAGAIVTWDAGGNDFMEVARVVQACERAGIATVLLTGEEDPESGGPSLLEPLPEMTSVVSSGIGGNMWYEKTTLPAVERVVGPTTLVLHYGPNSPLIEIDAHSEIKSLQWEDHYGFERRSCFTF
ncbi:MAG: hypothetical protein HY682_03775 [Chloroflexi bacterium]|nr:hypothetical protein [Chloroflexota bacterium]